MPVARAFFPLQKGDWKTKWRHNYGREGQENWAVPLRRPGSGWGD